MHIISLVMALLPLTQAAQSQAQTPAPSPDTVPAPTNVQGAQYPRITSDLRAIFRIKAPDAQKVEFAFYSPKRYPATKDAAGFWTATTEPLVPGFHYYRVFIDSAEVNDPSSETFFGTGKDASAAR
jgi:1,4-alpha-glucan branching enzyme